MNYKEKLKTIINSANTPYVDILTFLKYFPELKESEDDKVRKALICGMHALKSQHREYFASIPIDNIIAWLEKKSDNKSELNNFESELFSAFSDAWQQYLDGEEVDVVQWVKEHSPQLLAAARNT